MSTPEPTEPLPDDTRLGRTALRVTDIEATTEFYTSVVGLTTLDRTEHRRVLGADTPCLVLEHDPEAAERRDSATGLYHTAFRVPSQPALGDALHRIRTHWTLDGASDHGVSQALYLSDPEGNGVEIYRDYPRDSWPFTAEGRVDMRTDPLDLMPLESIADGHPDAPAGTTVGHIHLEVSSLETFRSLYVDRLGFEVQATVPDAAFIGAGGYHHHIGANTWHNRSTPQSGRGLDWFEIVVPDDDTMTAIRSRLDDWDGTVTETDESLVITDHDAIEVHITHS